MADLEGAGIRTVENQVTKPVVGQTRALQEMHLKWGYKSIKMEA